MAAAGRAHGSDQGAGTARLLARDHHPARGDQTAARRSLEIPDDGQEEQSDQGKDGPEEHALVANDFAQLRVALAKLPERCRKLLRVIAASDEANYGEVAAALDMPVGSIGPTRSRCLERLRVQYTQSS